MKVIVGLGNPTKEYQNTFHNIGFAVLENLTGFLQVSKKQNKFQSIVFQGKYKNNDYILLLPQTYMNLSGTAVFACLRFYKISLDNLLVVYDNLDLDVGKIRYKEKGGGGGHNGLKDIIQKLSSKDFARLSIGIGRPESKEQVSNYVLKKIPQPLKAIFAESIEQASKVCCDFLTGEVQPTSIKIN